ncbi:homeobox domain-containing protein [Caerostris darwini]|uniref:Homeobox domain-containing protein n=1 Tax=Caerostris darwini TaxID=1538125 RepID=A0AAV4NCI2_9ARAC|nr:homeobox domain-containing protein [Caerostris darwini]
MVERGERRRGGGQSGSFYARILCVALLIKGLRVWFQNRRSKERRMKQLSSMGARRHFFRSPRRAMRPLRPGMSPDGLDDSPDMVSGPNSGYTYFSGFDILTYGVANDVKYDITTRAVLNSISRPQSDTLRAGALLSPCRQEAFRFFPGVPTEQNLLPFAYSWTTPGGGGTKRCCRCHPAVTP